jgi:hypothetical protein
MFGIHPIRWIRQGISRSVKRAIVIALLASGTGLGGANIHTDGALGREAAAFVMGIVHPAAQTPQPAAQTP